MDSAAEPTASCISRAHFHEHLQAKRCGQNIYSGAHCDTRQLPQRDFSSSGEEVALGGGVMSGIGVHDVKFTKTQ